MNRILELLSPTVLVETVFSRFTLTTAKAAIQVDTYFYLVVKNGKVRQATIDEYDEFSIKQGAFRVDVFKVDDLRPPVVNRQELPEAFLGYGLLRCWDAEGKWRSPRPG
jgi:hypothetical protein